MHFHGSKYCGAKSILYYGFVKRDCTLLAGWHIVFLLCPIFLNPYLGCLAISVDPNYPSSEEAI